MTVKPGRLARLRYRRCCRADHGHALLPLFRSSSRVSSEGSDPRDLRALDREIQSQRAVSVLAGLRVDALPHASSAGRDRSLQTYIGIYKTLACAACAPCIA